MTTIFYIIIYFSIGFIIAKKAFDWLEKKEDGFKAINMDFVFRQLTTVPSMKKGFIVFVTIIWPLIILLLIYLRVKRLIKFISNNI